MSIQFISLLNYLYIRFVNFYVLYAIIKRIVETSTELVLAKNEYFIKKKLLI